MNKPLKNKIITNKDIAEVHSKIGISRLKSELFFKGDVFSAVEWLKSQLEDNFLVMKKDNEFIKIYDLIDLAFEDVINKEVNDD